MRIAGVGIVALALAGLGLWWQLASPGPPAPPPIAGGFFEASGVVAVSARSALFVDDNNGRDVYLMEIGADGLQRGRAIRVTLGIEIIDPEAMTTDGRFVYAVGSQSKPGAPPGVGLARFVFDAEHRTVSQIEVARGLKALLTANVPELSGLNPAQGNDDFNIEGLAWDPLGSRLLVGLRAPVVNGSALVVPLALRDGTQPLSEGNLVVGQAMRLPLGGAGIRSLEYDAERSRFVVITGASPNAEDRDFRVMEWTPGAQPELTEVAQFPARLKPEGITRLPLAGGTARFLVFDVGRYAAIR